MNQAKIDELNEKINNAVSKKFDDAKVRWMMQAQR